MQRGKLVLKAVVLTHTSSLLHRTAFSCHFLPYWVHMPQLRSYATRSYTQLLSYAKCVNPSIRMQSRARKRAAALPALRTAWGGEQ